MAHTKKKSAKKSARAAQVRPAASTTKPAVAAATNTAVAATASARSTSKTPLQNITRFLPWILIVGSVIALLASLIITQEKFDLAANPHYQPICNLNPIISCGSVMKSDQAHAFGFMNPYIGIVGFPILLTMGVAMLAGAKFKRWFWIGAQIGLTFGFGFAYWLLWQSMYRIRALCPWCLTVDVAITTIFWYLTLYNFYGGNLRLPKRLRASGRFIKRHHADILVFWFLLVVAAILQHFWYYFGQHI